MHYINISKTFEIYFLTDKRKRSFFQAAVVSILLYGCTTWTLTKQLEKKLDGNYTRILRAILNKSKRQHSTRHQIYGHLPPITKTIQVKRTRHAGHCWRSKDELISDVLLWTPTYGRAKAGRPARTYIQQLCEDWGCSAEDLPEAMKDRENGERGSGISVLAARHGDDDYYKPPKVFFFRIDQSKKWLIIYSEIHVPVYSYITCINNQIQSICTTFERTSFFPFFFWSNLRQCDNVMSISRDTLFLTL